MRDVKTAAANLRQLENGNTPEAVYGSKQFDGIGCSDQLEEDRGTVVQAYLALVPEDADEPMDHEWALGCGFRYDDEKSADEFGTMTLRLSDNIELEFVYGHGDAQVTLLTAVISMAASERLLSTQRIRLAVNPTRADYERVAEVFNFAAREPCPLKPKS